MIPERFSTYGTTRRELLLALAAASACGRRKSTPYAGFAFIANQESHSVAVVDLAAFAVRRFITLESSPAEIAASTRAPLVYALAPEAGSVFEIDAESLTLKRRMRVGSSAVGMQLANGALWVLSREPRALVLVDLASFSAARTLKLNGAADDFDLSPDGHTAALALGRDQALALVDLKTARVDRVALAKPPRLVRFQGDGRQVLIGDRGDRAMTIVNVAARKVVVRLPLPLEPANFCFNADQGQLFVSGEGMDAVAIVYPYLTEVAQTLLGGKAPGVMAASSAPPYLFIANPLANNVTVLNIDTRKVLAVVSVGEEPAAIAITPDNQYALVLNRKSGDMAVIRLAAFEPLNTRRTKMAPLFTMIPVGSRPVALAVRAA